MTILYNAKKWLGYAILFKGKGSVVFQPRTIFSACVSGLVAAFCSLHNIRIHLEGAVGEPSVFFSAISFLLGFVLVYRAQEAYSRHWSASTEMQRFFSHLRSVAVMMRTWTPSVAVQLRFLTRLRVVAIISCDELRAKPTDYDFLLCSKLLSPDEALLLIGKRNRAGVCLAWLTDIVAVFIAAAHKGSKAGPRLRREITQPGRGHSFAREPEKIVSFVTDPQLGILFQELNSARLAYEQAKLVADIPYPFPYTQLAVFALAFYALFLPVLVASFVPDGGLSVIFCFITTLFTQAVSNVAMELENPFEGSSHAIPLDYYLGSFAEFIHDLVSSQLPPMELSCPLTLGKVQGIRRRLSMMPEHLDDSDMPGLELADPAPSGGGGSDSKRDEGTAGTAAAASGNNADAKKSAARAVHPPANRLPSANGSPFTPRRASGTGAGAAGSGSGSGNAKKGVRRRRSSMETILMAVSASVESSPARLGSTAPTAAAAGAATAAAPSPVPGPGTGLERQESVVDVRRTDGQDFNVAIGVAAEGDGSDDEEHSAEEEREQYREEVLQNNLERAAASADAALREMKGTEMVLQGVNLALVRKKKGFTVVS